MFIDALTRIWNAAVLTATANSTSSYDTGRTGGNDISVGEPLVLCLVVTSAAKVSSTDETYQFNILQSAAAALTSPDTLLSIAFTNAQAGTLLAAGAVLGIPIPIGSITKRYLGASTTIAGTSPTVTVTAWFCPASMVQKNVTFPTNITIL